jgi:uncharacterized membrane protein
MLLGQPRSDDAYGMTSSTPIPNPSGPDGDRASGRVPEHYTWPLVAIAIMIIPQVAVPTRYKVGPPVVVPIVEGLAFLGMLLIAARPGPVPRSARPFVLTLFSVLIVANVVAAGRLVVLTLRNSEVDGAHLSATRLLVAGAMVVGTNFVTFAVLYWELDSGGPYARVFEPERYPDFQFPQTHTTGLAPPGWIPRFPDHLYLAYTNVVAFSPTDTMPLTVRAKALMAVQSIISVGVLVVVVSRVINLLPP